MPEVTAADRQNAFLDRARKLYSDGKFNAALAAFKEASSHTHTEAMTNDLLTHSLLKALLRCPCTRDVLVQSKKMGLSLKEIQISRCHCKNFESLAISGSPKLAMYTLAKRACTCGSDVFHCNVSTHLNALDGIIATYEKMEAPVKARQYATLLIITSPRAPEGYLRLAKALRMCDTEQSPETIARCRWIYRQAIQSVQAYGNKDHPKLKIMADLLRMDILGSMPPELQTMILGALSNPDLCRSMRVSKAWKRACLDPSLWRHLTFVRASGRVLRKGVFNTIISKRAQGKVKSLTLWGMNKLRIDLPIFKATLRGLKQLESLSLKGVSRIEEIDSQAAPPLDTWSRALFEEAPQCLKTLDIGAFRPGNVSGSWSAPPAIPMAQSLEKLHLDHMTRDSAIIMLLYSTVWPKLRKLTISSNASSDFLQVNLERLVQATPSLKDLCITNLAAVNDLSTPSWDSLERLTFTLQSPALIFQQPGTFTNVPTLPRLCTTIRSLEFPSGAVGVLSAYQVTALIYPHLGLDPTKFTSPVTELERLEHLYLRDSSIEFRPSSDKFEALSWFIELIKPSMSNSCLTSLAVTFCPDTQFLLDKALNKPAIRTLSCFDFLDGASGSSCGDTFAHWVRGFPNLTTVGVFPQRSEGCWMHVSKVLARESRIETIYTDVLVGQPRDWVLAKAKEKGVKIIEASRIPEPVLQPLEPE